MIKLKIILLFFYFFLLSSSVSSVFAEDTWSIRSVDTMKETKDKVCNQVDNAYIDTVIERAQELNVTHITISTPYDNPTCGNAVAYGQIWSDKIHAAGLKVWHRHMPLAHEGIYDTPKDNSDDYLDLISGFIVNNPTMFEDGDIFTPIPEPQNGGIQNVTGCGSNICQYSSTEDFNQWLRTSMLVSELSFDLINKDVEIGYFGFDGFVAWGHNNPDWNGILEDATVERMGNVIAIDHYPQTVGTTMSDDLDELHARYPNALIVIGEWGTIVGGESVSDTMTAAQRDYVIGFNYWHLGADNTNESLIDNDFNRKPAFCTVKNLFE